MHYMVYSCFSWCWASGWTKGSSAPQRGNVVLSKNHLWSPSTLWKMPGWKTSFAGTGILAWTGAALLYIINLHIPYEEKHHLNIENGWIGQHGQRKMRMNRRILRATKFFQCPSGCHKGSPEVTMDNVWGPTNLGFHEAIWQGFGSEYLPLHENGWIPPLRFWDSSIASKRWENNLATLFATGWKPTCHAKHHENGQSPFSTGWMFRSIVSHWCVFFLLCYRRVISHIVWLVVLTESRNSFSSSSFCGTKKNVNSHVFFLRAFTQVASRNAPVGSAPDLAPNEDVDGPSTSLLNYFNKVMTCLAISYQHLYFSYWHRWGKTVAWGFASMGD